MKKQILLLLLHFAGLQTLLAQDSLYIRPFLNKKDFPNIDTIYYENVRSQGKIGFEGWTILERKLSESKILRIEGIDDSQVARHKIGIWKYYRKDQTLEGIDSVFFENGILFGSESYYFKSGKLRRYISRTFKNEIYQKGILTDKKIEIESNKEYIQYDYSEKGKLMRKRIWIGKKL
ncbi:hypothetical protein, partial [Fluviicola sp.]|uniref:hypothetical protein n=1 Tax=Fluviicola sp. TaxID=1917219 RepID=UPI0026030A69